MKKKKNEITLIRIGTRDICHLKDLNPSHVRGGCLPSLPAGNLGGCHKELENIYEWGGVGLMPDPKANIKGLFFTREQGQQEPL